MFRAEHAAVRQLPLRRIQDLLPAGVEAQADDPAAGDGAAAAAGGRDCSPYSSSTCLISAPRLRNQPRTRVLQSVSPSRTTVSPPRNDSPISPAMSAGLSGPSEPNFVWASVATSSSTSNHAL